VAVGGAMAVGVADAMWAGRASHLMTRKLHREAEKKEQVFFCVYLFFVLDKKW